MKTWETPEKELVKLVTPTDLYSKSRLKMKKLNVYENG